ncbi:MAG: UDP-N-acetylglucosamine 2-epimerase (non-hydrolyzing) [Candidatus Zixiibacteriota bacterium]|nr:MAG: UDP-N-acetylglucosamine 2-epimerase (non-hydrolyzing) [candidate division Zixibacteria bacterium]
MSKIKIVLVVGARPNFMKSAPLMRALRARSERFETVLIHTGQHYDHKLSQLFFDELKMPKPNIYLGVGSGSHAEQTARIMTSLESELIELKPDLVVVFGDVNSTLATAVVTSKLWIKLAHVEAGLRSFDNTMPEEINRIVTDRLSDYLFVSEPSGLKNLKSEGVPDDKVFFVGNIMIDSLVYNLDVARKSDILTRLSLKPREYIAMTMHRPSNVDNPDTLKSIMEVVRKIGQRMPVIFPCHPRTQNRLNEFGLDGGDGLRIIEPLGYLDFLKLQAESRFVLTDSGGIQEETTYLKIPCITMRESTERPITSDIGTNVITGTNPDKIAAAAFDVLDGKGRQGKIPDLWDGRTAERIVELLAKHFK